jgi:hypothetical protein
MSMSSALRKPMTLMVRLAPMTGPTTQHKQIQSKKIRQERTTTLP